MDLLNDLTPQYELASTGRRYGAAAIDYLILFALATFLLYMFGDKYVDEEGTAGVHLTGLPAFLVMFFPWFLVMVLIEGINDGKTIGKALLRIKVVKQDGSKAEFGLSLVRHLFDFIDAFLFGVVGVLVAGNNPQKQRVGDLVAKTIVIKA